MFISAIALYAIARYMLSPVRPSVGLSHGWISQRRLKLESCNLHHEVAHDSSFLTLNFHREIPKGTYEAGAQNERWYEKCAIFRL